MGEVTNRTDDEKLIAGVNKEADINIVEKLDNKDKDWDKKKD